MPSASEIIQRVIFSLDEGRGKTILRYLLATGFAAAVFIAYAVTQFHGLTEAGAMDNAQIARNLAEGHGYTTQYVRPLDTGIAAVRENTTPFSPELRRAPFPAWLLSKALRLAAPSYRAPAPHTTYAPETRALVPLGVLLSLLTALLIVRLGILLFDQPTGVLAGVLYVVSDIVLRDSIAGPTRSCMALLATAASYAAVKSIRLQFVRGKATKWVPLFIASAALAGVSVLCGYGMIAVPLALAFFLAHPSLQHRTTTYGMFTALAAAVIAPWAVRNYALTGNILGLAQFAALHDTVLYPGDLIERTAVPQLHSALVIQAMRAKLVEAVTQLNTRQLLTAGFGVIGSFFLVSLFMPYEREETQRFRWTIIIALAPGLVWTSLAGNEQAMIAVMAPFVVLYGVAGFRAITAHFDIDGEWKIILTGVIIVLTALPAALKITVGNAESPYPPYFPPFIAATSACMGQDEPIASDTPEATAWYGRHQAVLLPVSTDALISLSSSWRPIKAAFLTSVTGDRPFISEMKNGPWKSWKDVLELRVPDAFPLKHAIALPPEGHEQLFLADRVRWQDADPTSELPEVVQPRGNDLPSETGADLIPAP